MYGMTKQEQTKAAAECLAKLRARGRHGCRAGCHMDAFCELPYQIIKSPLIIKLADRLAEA